jgi:DNA-directed RNA polymerase specialized sigma24 family protein
VSAADVGVTPADSRGNSAFATMFDAHAGYLYDYCLSLIGNEAEAISATRVTLVAAFMLGGRLREPDRQRAWLFALARRECLSEMPTRRQPWVTTPTPVRPAQNVNRASISFAEADTSEMPRQGFDAEIRRAVRILAVEMAPRRDLRLEVLNLVHRYGIVPSELPAILDISPDATQDLLAAARVMRLDEGSYDAPLAVLPASVWRETADVIFGADQREYREAIVADAGRLWAEGLPEEPANPPSTRKLAMTSAGLAAALLAPAALGACAYVIFAVTPAAATRTHDVVAKPTATPQTSTSVPAKTVAHATTDKVHHKAHHKGRDARVSVHSLPTSSGGAPTKSVSPSHKTSTSPSPKPSSSTPVIDPSPSSSGSPSPSSSGGSPSGGSSSGGQSPSGGPSSGGSSPP